MLCGYRKCDVSNQLIQMVLEFTTNFTTIYAHLSVLPLHTLPVHLLHVTGVLRNGGTDSYV